MNRERQWNGGPRRITHHINRYPAVNIHHATRYSERIGLPLNLFVTINFTCAGCSPDRGSELLRKMIAQRFAPWLRRTASTIKDVPPTYVWCMEAAGGQLAAHILVHVPSDLASAFEDRVRQWLLGLFGVDSLDPAIVKIKPIYNLIGARRYVLKGAEPVWARHLGVNPVTQGVVIGKRSGFSRNLGPAARERGGYRPRRVPRQHR
jgi:hypothetical protein